MTNKAFLSNIYIYITTSLVGQRVRIEVFGEYENNTFKWGSSTFTDFKKLDYFIEESKKNNHDLKIMSLGFDDLIDLQDKIHNETPVDWEEVGKLSKELEKIYI